MLFIKVCWIFIKIQWGDPVKTNIISAWMPLQMFSQTKYLQNSYMLRVHRSSLSTLHTLRSIIIREWSPTMRPNAANTGKIYIWPHFYFIWDPNGQGTGVLMNKHKNTINLIIVPKLVNSFKNTTQSLQKESTKYTFFLVKAILFPMRNI